MEAASDVGRIFPISEFPDLPDLLPGFDGVPKRIPAKQWQLLDYFVGLCVALSAILIVGCVS